jgi:hypothetical protein
MNLDGCGLCDSLSGGEGGRDSRRFQKPLKNDPFLVFSATSQLSDC